MEVLVNPDSSIKGLKEMSKTDPALREYLKQRAGWELLPRNPEKGTAA